MSEKILLVEGYTDTLLFRALLKNIGIEDVKVLPPKDLGGNGNGVSNVLSVLPALLANVKVNQYSKFAILIDADYQGKNGGYNVRKGEVDSILTRNGYSELAFAANNQFGSEYSCGTQIPIHLGILPNHSGDGMIEDLLLECTPTGVESTLLNHARTEVARLPYTAFNRELHTAKAELATYLSWSKSPGCDNGVAMKIGAMDPNSLALSPLNKWLYSIFKN
jgi:hypothetical protein